jgi:transcription initiation factor IIF auxiliary subunit
MEPPFKCTNEGWGEFEMTIDLFTTEKGGKQTIVHDLNFAAAQYENVHTLSFKNPSQALQQLLRETGPLPSDEERKLKKMDGGKKKKTFDIDKIADGLIKLGEDDLLQVIQMVHDNKDDNTYVQNNIDAGEFSVDLYTLPDALLKMLWDYMVRCRLAPSLPFLSLSYDAPANRATALSDQAGHHHCLSSQWGQSHLH